MSSPPGSSRRYPVWPMVVLGIVNLVDQVDMAILRGVLPFLEEEWGLSDFELGLLGFSFVVVNTLATIPAGWVADRVRRTRLMGWTLVSWSGLIALSATAVNYGHLLFARAVMGIGQSIDDPASTSLLGDYYTPRQRARAFSVQQVALFVGSGIGLALGGLVGSALGWRWAFLVVGVPGSLAALLVFRMREPTRGEADLLDQGHDPAALPSPDLPPLTRDLRSLVSQARRELVAELRMIFGIRTMRYILVGVSALLFTVSGIGYWLAIYHQRHSGMDVSQATAFTALLLAIGGGVGTIAGGNVADRTMAAHGPSRRIAFSVWAAVACAALFAASFAVPVIPARLAMQLLGVLAAAGSVPALRASMLDVVPAQSRGVGASAFALTSAVFGTALAPPLVGVISDITGSLVTAFYIVFPPVIAGLLLLLRARTTIVEDANAIFTALAERREVTDEHAPAAPASGPELPTPAPEPAAEAPIATEPISG